MNIFGLPAWIKPHMFEKKQFKDLSIKEINDLKKKIGNFRHNSPDVSVIIPAWNEENNIYRTISSLASSVTSYNIEIVVVNNNSSDGTQQVLDNLGILNYFQPVQGTPFARQMGLEKARGKFHLCADADTFYPPDWIELMVKPMIKDAGVTGVYGRYSFLPPKGGDRFGLLFYELLTGIVVRVRQKKREYLNVYGFNMGFVTEIGRTTGGFKVKGSRIYAGITGSDYQNEAEDGRMACNLMTKGRLVLVTDSKARVFTSSRRLMDDGSIWKAFLNRAKRQLTMIKDFT